MRLKGRVAIITGGSQGIGEAFARRISPPRAHRSRSSTAIRARQRRSSISIRSSGGEALAVQADVARVGDIDAAVAQVVAAYGTVHILLNNAAVYLMSPLGGTTEQAFDTMVPPT